MSFAPRRAFAGAALAAAAVALSAGAAAAQAVNPLSLGVSAGAAIPTGNLGDAANTGFSVDGIIALRTPTSPVQFRGEVGYTRFGFKGTDDVNLRVISGVANVVIPFSAAPTATVRPYVIGGIGAYNLKVTADGDGTDNDAIDSETKLGLNAGVGIEIPLSGLTGFGEVRFTTVRTEGDPLNYVPIRFGIRF